MTFNRKREFWSATAAFTCAAAFSAVPAFAQSTVPATKGAAGGQASDSGAAIEEIIVTAERRASSIQKTPLAISAIGGDDLRTKQIADIERLAGQIPNVTFSRNGSDAKVFIRGIGIDAIAPGNDPRVAIYTDGVYNARTAAALTSLYDLERIEVLSGPQGTLYGRNATAGAMNILSREPGDSLNGYGTLTVGNYGLIRTEGAVGGPLGDTISARLAFQTNDRDGYGKNISNGKEIDDERSRAVRGTLKLKPSPDFTVTLIGDYRWQNDHNFGYHFLGNSPGFTSTAELLGYEIPRNPRDLAGSGSDSRLENYGFSGTAEWDLGGAVLTAVTGYKSAKSSYDINSDPSTGDGVPVYIREKSSAFSQELRLTHTIGPIDILLGGYYFHEKLDEKFVANIAVKLFLPPPPTVTAYFRGRLSGGTQWTNAYAGFAQATAHFTDRLALDAGIRYSREKRRMNEFSMLDFTNFLTPDTPRYEPDPSLVTLDSQRASWSSWTPKFTLHWQATDKILAYATYSVGFKSGGFNIGFLQPAFDPEKLKDFEAGIKADLFDRRLRMNLAGFYYKYSNLQVNITEGLQLLTRNAAKATLYGAEAQITALPVDDLKIQLNASWLHSRYDDYTTVDPINVAAGPIQLRGNQLTYAPKYKIDAEIGYTFHADIGDITPRVNVMRVARTYFDQFNHPWISQPARTELNLYLDYANEDSGWGATFYMKNATNKYYMVSGTIASDFLGFPNFGLTGVPRTFGVAVTKRF